MYVAKTVEVASLPIRQAASKPLLSAIELAQLSHLPPSASLLAKRLAAKQALFACLFQLNIQFDDYSDVSILHDDWGKPYFSFSKIMSRLLLHQGVTSTLLSIADEKCTAYAYVVLNLSGDGSNSHVKSVEESFNF